MRRLKVLTVLFLFARSKYHPKALLPERVVGYNPAFYFSIGLP